MSMLKSLQNIPSTITVFHSLKSPASKQLVEVLEKHSIAPKQPTSTLKSIFQRFTTSSSQERPSLYTLDITEKLPTKEQYQSIRGWIAGDAQNRASFDHLFPKFHLNELGSLPSMEDYQLRLDNKSQVFNPPLVVDWDHQLLATDAKSVAKIIEEFQN